MNEDNKSLSRRQLLGGATAAVLAGAAAPAAAAAAQSGKAAAGKATARQSAGGDGLVNLRCAMKETVLDGKKVRLRAYNDLVPGPLIETRPGATLRIRVKNDLPPYDSSEWNGDHNVPHMLDTTNLHVHGMDVIPHLFQPIGTSDPLSQMIAIRPGETQDYVFEVPADHPAGLYWYHPHHHGSTVVQAVTGMAGGIIIRGAIDEVPEIKAAREMTLVMQDIGLFPNDEVPDLWSYEPKQNAIWQTFGTPSGANVTIYDAKTQTAVPQPNLKTGFTTGDYALRYYLLNGEPFYRETHNKETPTDPIAAQLKVQRIRMRPGEVMRFRMLNASSDLLMPIVVEGHDVHLIALDGVNFDETRTIPYVGAGPDGQVLLAPANRAEFLIKGAAKPGVYRIIQLAQGAQFLESGQKTICEIEIVGTPKPMPLPGKLPQAQRNYPLIQPAEIARVRTIEFDGTFPGVLNPVVGIDFLINNMQYQETAVPIVVNRGECEEWHLVVQGPHHGGTEGHPFHIHVQQFEVISIGGAPQPAGTFMDTIWVPKETTVVVRIRFRQWLGKSVFHCHILPHEDTGMMQNFLIVDPKAAGHHRA
jgi:FtsP/CotA-like multicopper oxidase with cupredoxin domain